MVKSINNEKIITMIFRYYLFITLMCHVLFYIAPIVAIMMGTPFYNFQRYLGIIGGCLLLLDLFTYRYLFKTKNVIYLYLLGFIAIISSFLYIRYGIKENIFDIAWHFIISSIFYSYAKRVGKKQFMFEFTFMFKIISCIWIIACVISIFSFVFNTGYHIIANPYFEKFYIRQGFLEYRLFGVFMSIFSSSMISGILMIFSLFQFYLNNKKRYILNSVVFLLHIILSGSRSSIVSLFAVIVIGGFYYWFKHKTHNRSIVLKLIYSLIFTIFIFISSIGILEASKKAISYVPSIPIFIENSKGFKEIIKFLPNTIVQDTKSGNESKKIENRDLLQREDTDSENISNNRFNIWKDYLYIYQDIGLFGLSPNNFSEYIQQFHSELYIASYIKDAMPNRYNNGDVYEPHSGYVNIYVTTGVIGIVLLLTFLLLSLKDVVHYMKFQVDLSFYPFLLIVIFCLVNAFFDTTLFFDPELSGIVFWIIAGYVSYLSENREYKYNEYK